MLLLGNTHEKQKIKYSNSKVSNKFANQLDVTIKEKDIKYKVMEATKTWRKS